LIQLVFNCQLLNYPSLVVAACSNFGFGEGVPTGSVVGFAEGVVCGSCVGFGGSGAGVAGSCGLFERGLMELKSSAVSKLEVMG